MSGHAERDEMKAPNPNSPNHMTRLDKWCESQFQKMAIVHTKGRWVPRMSLLGYQSLFLRIPRAKCEEMFNRHIAPFFLDIFEKYDMGWIKAEDCLGRCIPPKEMALLYRSTLPTSDVFSGIRRALAIFLRATGLPPIRDSALLCWKEYTKDYLLPAPADYFFKPHWHSNPWRYDLEVYLNNLRGRYYKGTGSRDAPLELDP